jgi:hypothetical protein
LKKSCIKDFDQMMNKHGTYTMTTKNIKLLQNISKNTDERISCKYCKKQILQKYYIKHITNCARAIKNDENHHSPTKESFFKTGTFQNKKDTSIVPVRRQTPYDLAKGRTQELLKTNTFIQETINQTIPETQDSSRSFSRPTTRPNSAMSRPQTANSGNEENPENPTQIELLERKIQEIEDKLSPKIALQHAIKNKVMPFSCPKKSKPHDKSSNTKHNMKKLSKMSSNRMQGYSTYPDIPINQQNPPPIELQQCQHCNRTFNPQAFRKHSEICLRVFVGKRPFFDSSRARVKDTPMEFFYWKSRRSASGNGTRRPRSAPKTRRNDGTNITTGSGADSNRTSNFGGSIRSGGISFGDSNRKVLSRANSKSNARPPTHQLQQLQQFRSSTAPAGATRSERSLSRQCSNADSSSHKHVLNDRKPKRMKYYSKRKNYGLFSLRLNLFETPPVPIPTQSGGCRVVSANNWRTQSRRFREAITAARVLYFSRQCTNTYKC